MIIYVSNKLFNNGHVVTDQVNDNKRYIVVVVYDDNGSENDGQLNYFFQRN